MACIQTSLAFPTSTFTATDWKATRSQFLYQHGDPVGFSFSTGTKPASWATMTKKCFSARHESPRIGMCPLPCVRPLIWLLKVARPLGCPHGQANFFMFLFCSCHAKRPSRFCSPQFPNFLAHKLLNLVNCQKPANNKTSLWMFRGHVWGHIGTSHDR